MNVNCLNGLLSIAILFVSFRSIICELSNRDFCNNQRTIAWNVLASYGVNITTWLIFAMWAGLLFTAMLDFGTLVINQTGTFVSELMVVSCVLNLIAICWFAVPMLFNRVMVASKVFNGDLSWRGCKLF